MYRFFMAFLTAIFLAGSAFAAAPVQSTTPTRKDLVDNKNKSAQIKLVRAEKVLATLVPDPQDYTLILSNNTSIGAEAVPPHVYSDKPTIIVYQGTLSPDRSNEELAFVMAHELGHLHYQHSMKWDQQMDQIFAGQPAGYSGLTFAIFFQKQQEQQADLYGQSLYKQAGYDMQFFPYTLNLLKINQNIHFGNPNPFRKARSSLSLKDTHYSMLDRFRLLTNLSR